MNFNLPENPTYSDLKSWYLENESDLPLTLNSEERYYLNVKDTVRKCIEVIEKRISEIPRDQLAKDVECKSRKRILSRLYIDLQDRSQWNVPLKRKKM